MKKNCTDVYVRVPFFPPTLTEDENSHTFRFLL